MDAILGYDSESSEFTAFNRLWLSTSTCLYVTIATARSTQSSMPMGLQYLGPVATL